MPRIGIGLGLRLGSYVFIGGSGGGGGGGGGGGPGEDPPPYPIDTTIYDSEGNILFTVNGNVPEYWKGFEDIEGYVEIGTSATRGEIIFSGPLLDIDSSGPQVLSSLDLEEIINLLDLA